MSKGTVKFFNDTQRFWIYYRRRSWKRPLRTHFRINRWD